jgi:hypothetical protein
MLSNHVSTLQLQFFKTAAKNCSFRSFLKTSLFGKRFPNENILSLMCVRRIFATALLIIRDREKRFLSLVPKHFLANLSMSNRVSVIVSGLEK